MDEDYVDIAGESINNTLLYDVKDFCEIDMHVIMIGNPGAGKSTLLNSVAGELLFESGVSQITGLTTVLQTKLYNKLRVSDTPGLSDVATKEKAAEEICKGLSIGGPTKLVFVWTTNSGRVTAEHYATTEIVLEALIKLGVTVKGKYTVIINQVNPKETEKYACGVPDDLIKKGIKKADIGKLVMELRAVEPLKRLGLPGVCQVLYALPEMVCADNVLFPTEQSIWLRKLLVSAPVLDLPINNKVFIAITDINNRIREMEQQLATATKTHNEWIIENHNYIQTQLKNQKIREQRNALIYGAVFAALAAAPAAVLCVIQ